MKTVNENEKTFETKMVEAISVGESAVYVQNKRSKDNTEMFSNDPELVNNLKDFIFGKTDVNPMIQAQDDLHARKKAQALTETLSEIVGA